MRITLDQRDYDMNAGSVAEAIAACATVAEKEGRMIVEVVVDGVRWTNEQLETPDLVNESASEVELTSADPRSLLNEMFSDAADALDGAAAIQAQAAELLQVGERAAGLSKLHEALHVWTAVQQCVAQSAQLLDPPLEEMVVDGTPVTEIFHRLEVQLRSIFGHIDGEDMAALADSLLYELPSVQADWRALLGDLQRRTSDSAAAGDEELEPE